MLTKWMYSLWSNSCKIPKKNKFCKCIWTSIEATTNKDVRVFLRRRSLIKPSKGHASTATLVDPRGAVPRPISLVDRSRTDRRVCSTPIIYTAIVFRQVMPRLMSPRVPMRALHKGARGCAPREIHGCIRCIGHDLEVTTLVRKTKSSIPGKGQRRSRFTTRRGRGSFPKNTVTIGRNDLDYVG